MSKIAILVLSLLFLLGACGTAQNEDSPPPPEIDLNEGMGDTGEDNVQTDEELLIESRHEARMDLENKGGYTQLEAEDLVKDHLNITNKSSKAVMFDHEEDDHYIIKVVDLGKENNDNSDDNSNAWYKVNPKTGEINEYNSTKK